MRLQLLGILLVVLILSNCTLTSPGQYHSPLPADIKGGTIGQEVRGEACSNILFGVFWWGDGGYIAAVQNALEKYTQNGVVMLVDVKADTDFSNVLFVYMRRCTMVSGRVATYEKEPPAACTPVKHEPPPVSPPQVQAEVPKSTPKQSSTVLKALTKEQIEGYLKSKKHLTDHCVNTIAKASMSGQMVASWIISNTGKATDIKIVTYMYQGTPLSRCIISVIKNVDFGEFSGDPVSAEYPFNIHPPTSE